MNKYLDALPSYLDGDNITKHTQIITEHDKIINDILTILKDWNKLQRPILIEKIQKEVYFAKVKVHINTPDPIKKVTVKVDNYPFVTEYAEDDCVTTDVQTYDYLLDQSHLSVQIPFEVTVETYEGMIYQKGYPENDTIKKDIKDHDVFLDIIGNLLGIYRRKYRDWITSSVDIEDDLSYTYPPYFAKYDDEGNMVAGTEDDYYYLQRINYFIEHRNAEFMPALMMKILYEWEHIEINKVYNRDTSIIDPLSNYYYMIITDDYNTYINIDDTTRETQIRQYDIITRPSYISYILNTNLQVLTPYTNNPNYASFQTKLLTENNNAVHKAPIAIAPAGKQIQIINTTENRRGTWYILEAYGFIPQHQQIKLQYVGEYELESSNAVWLDIEIDEDYYFINVDKWNSKRLHVEPPATSTSPPYLTETGYLSMGYGNCVYMPALYMGWYEDCIIRIKFYYGDTSCEMGLSRINKVTDETVEPYDIRVNPSQIIGERFNTEHVAEFVFSNKTCTVFLDDINTGITQSFNNINELLYFYGYSKIDDDLTMTGLYITDMEILKTDDRETSQLEYNLNLSYSELYITYLSNSDGLIDIKLNNEVYNAIPVGADVEETTVMAIDTLEQPNIIRSKYKANPEYTSSKQTLEIACMDLYRVTPYTSWISNTATADAEGASGTRTPPSQDDIYINMGQRYDVIYTDTIDTSKKYTIFTNQRNRYTRLGLYKRNGTDYVPYKYKALSNMGATAHPNGQIKYEVWFENNTVFMKAENYPTVTSMVIDNKLDLFFGFYTTTAGTEEIELLIAHKEE